MNELYIKKLTRIATDTEVWGVFVKNSDGAHLLITSLSYLLARGKLLGYRNGALPVVTLSFWEVNGNTFKNTYRFLQEQK